MQMRVESGDPSVVANRWNSALLVAAGTNPYDLVDAAVTAAAQMSGGGSPGLSCYRSAAAHRV
jgi:raffinose synthase